MSLVENIWKKRKKRKRKGERRLLQRSGKEIMTLRGRTIKKGRHSCALPDPNIRVTATMWKVYGLSIESGKKGMSLLKELDSLGRRPKDIP